MEHQGKPEEPQTTEAEAQETSPAQPTSRNGDQDEEVRVPAILPLLPLRNTVVFPGMMLPLVIGREASVQLIDDVVSGDRLVALVAQRSAEVEHPARPDLFDVGCMGMVAKMVRFPDQTVRVIVHGLTRIHVGEFVRQQPYPLVKAEEAKETVQASTKIDILVRNLLSEFHRYAELSAHVPDEMEVMLVNIEEPGRQADMVASSLNIPMEPRQEVLEELDVEQRLTAVVALLAREVEMAEVSSKIREETHSEMGKAQREYFLRQQLKAIQKELGEEDERTVEINELREKLEKANPPEDVRTEAERELDRLSKMPPGSAEHTVSRTYMDWIVSLPWNVSTEDNLDIEAAERVLNEDHSDLEKIKERILEYLAVLKLKKDMKAPILCFVGPPGVGKTSLGRSIARSLGRKFARLSLGGVRDEAEIRGHRRTYIGALPGRIIQTMRKVGSNNPLIMLDEIDKLGSDFRGDPSSALLEVLDPEQNSTFTDHYLDVAFDLSRVMFITTGNVLETVPPPLRDRMEILRLPGYTLAEKTEIATHYLVPKQLDEHGLRAEEVQIEAGAIKRVVEDYTREAGVRNLEREIATICRKIAKDKARGKQEPVRVTAETIPQLLGPAKFYQEVAERTGIPGVVTGLAYTETGGDILFIEASAMPGKHRFMLTGQLGEVMKESAEAALTYIRTNGTAFKISKDFFEKHDIHIHVPAGATPKDGPSAGVAITLSLLSMVKGRPVEPNVAMTGEITLRGKVLPVGGIKEKVLAAHRAGIKTILVPLHNQKDLEDIPADVREQLEFHFCDTMQDAIDLALPGVRSGNARGSAKQERRAAG